MHTKNKSSLTYKTLYRIPAYGTFVEAIENTPVTNAIL